MDVLLEREAHMLLNKTGRVTLRAAQSIDLEEMATIEEAGAFEPASAHQLDLWLSNATPRKRRGRMLWNELHVAADAGNLVLGHCVLIGEDDVATLRIVIHPGFRRQRLATRLLTRTIDHACTWTALRDVEWIISERQAETLLFARRFGFVAREAEPVIRDWFGLHHDGFALHLPIVPPVGL